MVTQGQSALEQLLKQARETTGLSRSALARRTGLDPSYIYRIEVGERRPSRETVLVLAEALEVDEETMNRWLVAAGYAAMPLLTRVRGAVRTRGGGLRPSAVSSSDSHASAFWAESLETMGLQEARIGQLLQLMETAGLLERQKIADAVSTTFSHFIEKLEAPVQTAVIPAAGGQNRILSLPVMQSMLLRVIAEAVESGVCNIILVLASGMVESLYAPLKDALSLAVVPSIEIHCCEQAKPDGLGDAILQAEPWVNNNPFIVLLPDEIVRERIGRTVYSRELQRMMHILSQLDEPNLVAVTPVPKSKMPSCGVAKVGSQEVMPKIRPIVQLVEKPASTHPICHDTGVFGIVGRYLLQPGIFGALHELREKGQHPVHLTDALEHLRQAGDPIYAFELEATRQDIGEVLGRAREIIGDSSQAISITS